ncbi:hypothetical protein [Candidatus Nitrosocosmicus sp. R]
MNNNKILPYYRFSNCFDLVPSKELYDRYEAFRDFDDSYRGIDNKISVLNHNSVNVPNETVGVREYETQEVSMYWNKKIKDASIN